MSDPKFHKGQVVIIATLEHEPPIKIYDVMRDADTNWYKYSRTLWIAEQQLRPLNDMEYR